MTTPATEALPSGRFFKLRPNEWGVQAEFPKGTEAPKVGDALRVRTVTRRGRESVKECRVLEIIRGPEWSGTTWARCEIANGEGVRETTHRERLERRQERREQWAEGQAARSSAEFAKGDAITRHIPLGQPILVGHHSEKRHRRDVEKADSAYRRSWEAHKKADEHAGKADGIARALRASIYDDDPDAIPQLRAKLETMETRREQMKAINREIAKRMKGNPGRRRVPFQFRQRPPALVRLSLDAVEGAAKALDLPEVEIRALRIRAQGDCWSIGFDSYEIGNLGGNINRTRKRIARLERMAAL